MGLMDIICWTLCMVGIALAVYLVSNYELFDEVEDEMNGVFIVTCYGQTKIYKECDRAKVMKHFREGIDCCDGCERERYMNVFLDLLDGKMNCTDERD